MERGPISRSDVSGAGAQAEIRRVLVDDPEALALLEAYFAELRDRLGAFDPPTLRELRADAEHGVTLLCSEDGRAVGCGSLRRLDGATAEVKRMFVAASARGRGHARRLLRALEDEAATAGCTRVVLDTAAPLHEAAGLYLQDGYAEVERYNDNPFAARWFEKRLGAAR